MQNVSLNSVNDWLQYIVRFKIKVGVEEKFMCKNVTKQTQHSVCDSSSSPGYLWQQTNCNSFDLFCFMYYRVPSTTKKVPEILSGGFQIIRGQRSRSANQRREYKSWPIKDVHIVFGVDL